MNDQLQKHELSPDQTQALGLIHEWLEKPVDSSPEFKLGGFAGTGKTTLIRRLLDDIEADNRAHDRHGQDYDEVIPDDEYTKRVAIVSFTGKAVSVLRKKGLSAFTIHSSIYTPVKKSNGEVEWQKKIVLENDATSNPDLIIVDEASMISLSLYNDLKSYQKKILWVGDPGQLEPIGDNPDLMRSPDYTLTQVHRQALENPILKLSLDVRQGIPFLNGCIGPNQELQCVTAVEMKYHTNLHKLSDIIICGFNKERVVLNRRVRELSGWVRSLPCIQERIIILQNCADLDVFNGQIMTIVNLGPIRNMIINSKKYEVQWVDTEDELGVKRSLPLWTEPFLNKEWDEKKNRCPSSLIYCDYGYAITCHKSQGSEWDSVLVFEPSWWPNKPGFSWDQKRWRYTAITRAAKKLIYARS